jgi:hypothetical protein
MSSLSFYRQARVDGGIRTGIDVDWDPAWEGYEPGGEESDPALLWYVDVRCEGESLPRDRDRVRQWFLDLSPTLKPALAALASKLRVGYDDEAVPYQFPVPGTPAGVSVVIVCSAVRGLGLGRLGTAVGEIGERWEDLLRGLSPAEVPV